MSATEELLQRDLDVAMSAVNRLKKRIAELEAERDRLRAALLSAPPTNMGLYVTYQKYVDWYRANVEPLKDA